MSVRAKMTCPCGRLLIFLLCVTLSLVSPFFVSAYAEQDAPIQVGVIASSAPACYWDETSGKYMGVIIDVLDALSQKTGLSFQYVEVDLKRGAPVAQLKQGVITIVAGVLRTPRFMQDPELALSDELVDDSLVIVGRRSDDFTQDPSEKVIAVPIGFQVGLEYVGEQFPQHRKVEYGSVTECLNAVSGGKADATIYTRICLSYFLQNPHYDNLEMIPAFSRNVDTCIAGLAGQASLIQRLNDGLAKLTDDERNSIILNFTIMNPYRMTIGDVLYKYRVPLVVIAFLLLAVAAALIALGAIRRSSAKKLLHAYHQEQRAHEEMKVALALAQQASAAKGNFMSRMSHEIRTPLNAVIGYNAIAREEMSAAKNEVNRRQADTRVMDCLVKSELASKHLLTIINDVLDMSAIETGKISVAHERFDLKGMISALTSIFYSQAKAKGVNFQVAVDRLKEEWFVGDPLRVNQILTNLLSNAIKFIGGGGCVKLTIRQLDSPQPAEADKTRVYFEVSDTGIGMKQEYLERIWTPFEQADDSISRRFGGTGLGLSITKTLVDLMGGDISVKSELDVGSVFSVELPLARAEQPETAKTFDFGAVNALVADDDANARDYVQVLFSQCGARCTTVDSGEEAVRAFEDAFHAGDTFTVCLIDWRMPDMDGIETVRRIRCIAGDDLPIIIVTAYDLSEIAAQAREAGANGFLSKPLFPSSLFDALASSIGARMLVPSKENRKYHFKGARVLLAEDNAMNMEVAKRMLQSVELTVDGAWNGREALEMYEAEPPGTYKVILMDIQMPEMDGHKAARAIRASGRPDAGTIPIIAMTADAFAENVAEALASGMNGHIAKPIDMPKLFNTLSTYISQE